jgi:hypothetical protein
MIKTAIPVFCAAALGASLVLNPSSATQNTPPGHPAVQPQMPPGHPSVGSGQGEAPGGLAEDVPPAAPEDVASIDALVTAYYDVISGPAGQARDWGRFRSLFNPDARFITSRVVGGRAAALKLTPAQFAEANRTYFEKGGYFEKEIHRHVDRFGNIAQVFSTYEARQDENSPQAYSRGINSFQLLSDGKSWWIVNILWDYERADDNPLPAEYLP